MSCSLMDVGACCATVASRGGHRHTRWRWARLTMDRSRDPQQLKLNQM